MHSIPEHSEIGACKHSVFAVSNHRFDNIRKPMVFDV